LFLYERWRWLAREIGVWVLARRGEMVAGGRDLLEAKSNVRATHVLNIDNQYLHM
jgi:hypothetical protein